MSRPDHPLRGKYRSPLIAAILTYVTAYYRERAYPPTLREIAEHVGVRAVSSVHRHMETLVAQGKLRKEGVHSRPYVPVGPPGWQVELLMLFDQALDRSPTGVSIQPWFDHYSDLRQVITQARELLQANMEAA